MPHIRLKKKEKEENKAKARRSTMTRDRAKELLKDTRRGPGIHGGGKEKRQKKQFYKEVIRHSKKETNGQSY